MKPEAAVKLVEVLETLNKNKKLLMIATILAVALVIDPFGDPNPDDWSVL
jgi:capsular polysaccharide biosynthesis protein